MLSQVLVNSLTYMMAGVLTGVVSGVLGIGGGIIVVPALLIIFNHVPEIPQNLEMHMATATSLTVMIFTSLSTIVAHARKHDILWPVYQRLVPGIVSGVIFGA